MKRFKYKISPLAITFIIISITASILAILFSILKLCGLPNSKSIFPALDVITIIASSLFLIFNIMVSTIHYEVNNKGIILKLGFLVIKGNSFSSDKIRAIVYKAKENRLLVVTNLDTEEIFGSVINISPNSFTAFVNKLKTSKIAFDYIEDYD